MTQITFLPRPASSPPVHREILAEWMEIRPFGGFQMVMVDPPWSFDTWSERGHEKAPQAQYACHGADWIEALPIRALAADDAILWLWATGPLLPLALRCVESWGFEFKTMGWWSKKTTRGNQSFGTGYILRNAGEPFLIGTIGKPRTVRNTRSTIEGLARRHSQKPDEAFRAAERMLDPEFHPDPKRIDVFSRTSRPGWTAWGDQVGTIQMEGGDV